MPDVNALGDRAEDAKVAPGVDETGADAVAAQGDDGQIHRMALGDAAEIDPERSVESDATTRQEPDVPPVCMAGLRDRFLWGGHKSPADQSRPDGGIEGAIGEPGQPKGFAQDEPEFRGNLDRPLVCAAIEPGEFAPGIMKAHLLMDLRDGSKRRVHGAARGATAACGADFHDGPKPRPGTAGFT